MIGEHAVVVRTCSKGDRRGPLIERENYLILLIELIELINDVAYKIAI